MLFEEFEAIFGEPQVEWSNRGGHPLRRFLYYVHAPDPSHLRIHVTDFHSNTWEALRSVHELEDMRDNIGIGGSWSEFIDYFVASIKSEDVKLVMHGQSDSGATSAKLVAQKAKGMPLILVTLVKLVDFAARELMGNLSMQLFMALKNTRTSLAEEQERSRQLTKLITAEKNESIQNKLESFSKKQKLPITSALAMSDASDPSTEKVVVQDATSTRVTNRVVPSHRRSKVRGVLLQNPEDD
ncbi:uncharacterized protein LOC115750515 isoform X4 [Rhodamnia argentea]|uniref:Uncharacterized protein LOC115750515 isoform X4 n=1 Tax=Rhodamnia argentea TaxID=178133 RepID=A0ABM3GWF5_9MYRT|nr:uncharacterized protein LOC115750515 isoform X4 [Rhodamnia argentea]